MEGWVGRRWVFMPRRGMGNRALGGVLDLGLEVERWRIGLFETKVWGC